MYFNNPQTTQTHLIIHGVQSSMAYSTIQWFSSSSSSSSSSSPDSLPPAGLWVRLGGTQQSMPRPLPRPTSLESMFLFFSNFHGKNREYLNICIRSVLNYWKLRIFRRNAQYRFADEHSQLWILFRNIQQYYQQPLLTFTSFSKKIVVAMLLM